MTINPQWILIAAAAVAVLAAFVAISAGVRRARTAQLRDHFGGEYKHAVEATGSRTRAEQELLARAEEVKAFDIRPLSAADRDRFTADWRRIESRFIERPTTAVVEADELINAVMTARGYPMADFAKHAAHLSVKHPKIVEHYRAGHAALDSRGMISTEGLRQSMLHYRALFSDLVNEGVDVPQEIPVSREVAPRPIVREPAPDEYPRGDVRK